MREDIETTMSENERIVPSWQDVAERWEKAYKDVQADLRYALSWFDKETLREFKADSQGAVIFAKVQDQNE
jgi:hypothetical protein